MALSKDRNTPFRDGTVFRRAVKAGVVIHAGALVVLDAGFAAPGRTAVGLVAAGRAESAVDNTSGASGDTHVDVRRGIFAFNSDLADPVTAIGGSCFIVDDETVAATSGGDTRSPAGRVLDVEDDVVWVEIG